MNSIQSDKNNTRNPFEEVFYNCYIQKYFLDQRYLTFTDLINVSLIFPEKKSTIRHKFVSFKPFRPLLFTRVLVVHCLKLVEDFNNEKRKDKLFSLLYRKKIKEFYREIANLIASERDEEAFQRAMNLLKSKRLFSVTCSLKINMALFGGDAVIDQYIAELFKKRANDQTNISLFDSDEDSSDGDIFKFSSDKNVLSIVEINSAIHSLAISRLELWDSDAVSRALEITSRIENCHKRTEILNKIVTKLVEKGGSKHIDIAFQVAKSMKQESDSDDCMKSIIQKIAASSDDPDCSKSIGLIASIKDLECRSTCLTIIALKIGGSEYDRDYSIAKELIKKIPLRYAKNRAIIKLIDLEEEGKSKLSINQIGEIVRLNNFDEASLCHEDSDRNKDSNYMSCIEKSSILEQIILSYADRCEPKYINKAIELTMQSTTIVWKEDTFCSICEMLIKKGGNTNLETAKDILVNFVDDYKKQYVWYRWIPKKAETVNLSTIQEIDDFVASFVDEEYRNKIAAGSITSCDLQFSIAKHILEINTDLGLPIVLHFLQKMHDEIKKLDNDVEKYMSIIGINSENYGFFGKPYDKVAKAIFYLNHDCDSVASILGEKGDPRVLKICAYKFDRVRESGSLKFIDYPVSRQFISNLIQTKDSEVIAAAKRICVNQREQKKFYEELYQLGISKYRKKVRDHLRSGCNPLLEDLASSLIRYELDDVDASSIKRVVKIGKSLKDKGFYVETLIKICKLCTPNILENIFKRKQSIKDYIKFITLESGSSCTSTSSR